VPVTRFEFEKFGIPVRRVTGHSALAVGIALDTPRVHAALSKPLKSAPTLVAPAQATKIFLPSPSVQGLGSMCLHSGVRPVDRPAALPSLQLRLSAPERTFSAELERDR
jgi:hypothetical protein